MKKNKAEVPLYSAVLDLNDWTTPENLETVSKAPREAICIMPLEGQKIPEPVRGDQKLPPF